MSNSNQSHDQNVARQVVHELDVREMCATEGGTNYEPIRIWKRIDKATPLIAAALSDDVVDEFVTG